MAHAERAPGSETASLHPGRPDDFWWPQSALGALTALLIITQAWLLAMVISTPSSGTRVSWRPSWPSGSAPGVVIATRAGLSLLHRAGMADRASASAKSELRTELVERVAHLGPVGPGSEEAGRLTVLGHQRDRCAGRLLRPLSAPGLLGGYRAGRRSPGGGGIDWISAVIIAVTVPLIPLFMALVGTSHQGSDGGGRPCCCSDLPVTSSTWCRDSHPEGISTGQAQAATIRDITNRYREATMATLRVAFLSSLILELLATLSVALVAVAVGLRLLGGHLSLATALFVLILAPEAYLPLRLLGSSYHASAEGMQAAEGVFQMLERPVPVRGTRTAVPDPSSVGISITDLGGHLPGSLAPGPARTDGDHRARRGDGGHRAQRSGKSTLLGALLGFVPVSAGQIDIGGVDLATLDPDAWRQTIAWVPQRTHLFARTIADNIRLGRPGATDEEVATAVADAGLPRWWRRLPLGLSTRLGKGAPVCRPENASGWPWHGRSCGMHRSCSLDEPTANLDGETEEGVLASVRRLMEGRTVIMAAHRPSLLALADRVDRPRPGGGGTVMKESARCRHRGFDVGTARSHLGRNPTGVPRDRTDLAPRGRGGRGQLSV